MQDYKGSIRGGPIRTITLELARAFPTTTQSNDIQERSGLREFAYIGSIHLDLPLLTTLVEIWDQDYYSFHLPTSEMTVTLLDVYQIWGLPMRGTLIQ